MLVVAVAVGLAHLPQVTLRSLQLASKSQNLLLQSVDVVKLEAARAIITNHQAIQQVGLDHGGVTTKLRL